MATVQKNENGASHEKQNSQLTKDDLESLQERISSLSTRGEFAACLSLIEENMRTLYEKERWPDIFFQNLRTYQRCFSFEKKNVSFEEHLLELLKINEIPTVFAFMLRMSDGAITWNTDYFKNLALMAERYEDFETAFSYSDIIIKLDPQNSYAHVMRGWLLDSLGRHPEAIEMYEQAITLNEANHSARNSLAKHYATSNPSLALEHIEKAIELSPTEGAYYDTKAKVLVRQGERDAAILCYDLAIEASPLEADYPFQKGELLLQQDKEIAAIAQFRKALSLNSVHIPTLWRLAHLYKDSQPEMALMYLNTIVSQQPENADAQLMRGDLLGELGREEDAAEQFLGLIEQDAMRHEALAGYANILLQTDPDAALKYFEKAITIAPNNSSYHMGKARAYELLGVDAQAIKEYRAAISLDANNARAYARLAALIASSKPREAVDLYSKAIQIIPDKAYYYASKGEILMSMKDGSAEALSCFSNAVKYNPANAKLQSTLGILLEEAGDVEGAIIHLKEAVSLDKRDADAYYRLARLIFPTAPEIALLHINSAISLIASSSEYFFFKSKVLNELGHNTAALAQLQETLRADGKNAEALREISELLGPDSPKVALHYINHAIELAPENQDYYCSRANLLFEVGQRETAKTQFEQILNRWPKNHEAMYGLACCLAEDSSEKATDYLNKAIAVKRDIPNYHAKKAELLSLNGQKSEAVSAYDAALSVASDNLKYLLAKAKLLDELGDVTAACSAYSRVLAVSPACLEAIGRLGILLAEEKPTEAMPYLEHAVDLAPKEFIYRAWKGRALLALGNADLAAADFQTASRLGVETAETFFTLAKFAAEKLPESALRFCLYAIEKDESNFEYNIFCGKIFKKLDRVNDAIECFKQAAKFDDKAHEPRENLAETLYEASHPNALKAADFALSQTPSCPVCLTIRAKVLDEQTDDADVAEIIELLDRVLKYDPNFSPAREKLIEVLARKGSFMRLAFEKRKLAKAQKSRSKS